MKQVYFFALLFLSIDGLSQKRNQVLLEERQVETIAAPLDSILLIGVGSTTTRIFLDDVSQNIIEILGKDSVIAHYHYMGTNTAEAKSALDTLNRTGYKAILFFLPQGQTVYDIQGNVDRTTAFTSLGNFTPTIMTARVQYRQSFTLQLCHPIDDLEQIWTASLQFAGDLSKSKNAKNVASKILGSFKRNKYVK